MTLDQLTAVTRQLLGVKLMAITYAASLRLIVQTRVNSLLVLKTLIKPSTEAVLSSNVIPLFKVLAVNVTY